MITNSDEKTAFDIVARLRRGENAQSILNDFQEPFIPIHGSDESRLHWLFYIRLVQCTGSLPDILGLAKTVEKSLTRINFKSVDTAQLALRHEIPELAALRLSVLEGVKSNSLLSTSHIRQVQPDLHNKEASPGKNPAFAVPAKPWVSHKSNSTISELVSTFILHLNPQFRYVEEDLFLHAMQSGLVNSEYCSTFLVNSICALAAVNPAQRHSTSHY